MIGRCGKMVNPELYISVGRFDEKQHMLCKGAYRVGSDLVNQYGGDAAILIRHGEIFISCQPEWMTRERLPQFDVVSDVSKDDFD